MTTTVKVFAHCNPADTEVHYILNGNVIAILQDGEEYSYSVWGQNVITVKEVTKEKVNE